MTEEELLIAAVSACLRALLRDSDAIREAFHDAEDPNAFAAQLTSLALQHTVGEANALPVSSVLTGLLAHVSFIDQLAVVIVAWFQTRLCPLLSQPPAVDGMSVVTTSRNRVLSIAWTTVQSFVDHCVIAHKEATDRTTTVAAAGFLAQLGGARGVLTCLGIRETTGSRVVAPLTREQCLASFLQLNSKKEKLTVGARAFTKHCQRSSDGFWGELKGNDIAKNQIALARLESLLEQAVWKNIHSLPHGEVTFECRNADGYGARWYIRDQSFRGFLEPQMENGHDIGWRH